MEDEYFFGSGYKGTKGFAQHNGPDANAKGFSAAADNYVEQGIDLNEQLVMNKPATFFFRMNSDAMTGAGIQRDALLIVDRSLKATSGKIIVAVADGELMVRRYIATMNRVFLNAENEKFKPIELGEFMSYQCWGVVTCVIHIIDNNLLAYLNNDSRRKDNGDKSHISKAALKYK
jgi:DNA polymerase V